MPQPGPIDPVEQFYQKVEAAKVERQADAKLGTVKISEDPDPKEENTDKGIEEFRDAIYQKTSELRNLVMMDNTVGKVYPGAFLWARALRDGRLHQLPQLDNRPKVNVAFTGALDGAPLVFDYNGSYSQYQLKAAPVFAKDMVGGMKFAADFRISSNLQEALLIRQRYELSRLFALRRRLS